MKRPSLGIACVIVGFSLNTLVPAETRASNLKNELSNLIREDAAKNRPIPAPHTEEIPRKPTDVLVLEPLIVTEEKSPQFAVPGESRFARILRTGTIMQHVGKKTTVRLWTSGDAGIVISFLW